MAGGIEVVAIIAVVGERIARLPDDEANQHPPQLEFEASNFPSLVS